ncbi:MAG: MXAN_6640 family putative metalloprotease [Bacteroidota bacterium]
MHIFFLLISGFFLFITTTSAQDIPRPHCGNAYTSFKSGRSILSVQSRPELSEKFLSPSKYFLIHYDISGPNAVSLKDENSNGVPDYVDSAAAFFDYAYQVEVNEMGYRPPPKDNAVDSEYDIYLADKIAGIETYLYGRTESETDIGVGASSFIIVDNDFSSRDSLLINNKKYPAFYDTSYAALKATAAHEFHHAIQLGYRSSLSSPFLLEMTSTWMEYRLYPDTKAYEEFLPSLFQNLSRFTFGSSFDAAHSGYRHGIFGQYTHALYGDSLLKRTWELISKNGKDFYGFQSLDSAFKERGSSLAENWCGFLPWMYFTGERAQEGQFFKNAAHYPEVRFFYDSVFTSPSTTISGILFPYELRYLRVILPQATPSGASVTADIALANIDNEALLLQASTTQNYSVTITKSFENGSRSIPGTSYFINIAHNENICDTIFVSGGIQVVENAYPNPFKPNIDKEAFFPVPYEAVSAGKARLTVFKSDMQPAYSDILPVEIAEQHFTIRWTDIPESLSSGVYIYSVESNGVRSLGKIVIRR